MGPLVHSVELEPVGSETVGEVATQAPETVDTTETELDSDFSCSICMEVMRDAFLTACGHSFCYMCIVTHLRSKSDCPSCGHYLTASNLFPNFLLNKKWHLHTLEVCSAMLECLHLLACDECLVVKQGCEVSVKELNSFLALLVEKRRKMVQEEAETNTKILLDFLNCLRKQKLEELNEIQTDLQYVKEDINAVQRHRMELHRSKVRYPVKLGMLVVNCSMRKACPSLADGHGGGTISNVPRMQGQGWPSSGNLQSRKGDVKALGFSEEVVQRKDEYSGSNSQVTQSGFPVARKRVYAQDCEVDTFGGLKDREIPKNQCTDVSLHAELCHSYNQLKVVADVKNVDIFHSANIVSSIEFDRDDEFFATAGVSRRIKVYEFSSVVNDQDMQCPIAEMSSRSKLSCLSWNKYKKIHIASSDYDGMVTVWDVTTRQSVMEYEEHEKRAWSVDFSYTEPSMLVSGSDDCKVKIWCTRQEASALTIDMKANICSVKYNPGSCMHVAVASADHHVYYYDLRNVSQPLHVFSGHRKAVSYVKFLSAVNLLLHLLTAHCACGMSKKIDLGTGQERNTSMIHNKIRMFKGHVNEKNFVGLSVSGNYIACGSETNEVFVYHKAISKPAVCYKFASSDMDDAANDAGSYFISAVCWQNNGKTMLTANSQGTIKVLALAT
ncbi:unnamed protein product [Thlaspi arvense]|uniref:RING-type domain-containing protein n=1 Tax=Thlaspi arvense TaxID=13288 RepID=A0AAU9TBD7_THLAR|nr:unnamed protein product [Thlaspi arvense]